MANTTKQCHVCGVDCAGKPRVKDPKGRYYCKPCYDRAKTEKAGAAGFSAEHAARSSQDNPGDDDHGLLDDLLAAESQGGASPLACPACDAPMPHGAVICVQCGFNKQTGSAVAPPTVQTARPVTSSRTVWPWIVGPVSVLFGLMGILLTGLELAGVEPLTPEGEPSFEPGTQMGAIQFGSNVISLALYCWLTLGGVGVAARRYFGVTALRTWSIIAIVLAIIGVTCFFGMLLIGTSMLPTGASGEAASALGMAVVVVLVVVAVALAWPIFLLWWFKRPRIEAEISEW